MDETIQFEVDGSWIDGNIPIDKRRTTDRRDGDRRVSGDRRSGDRRQFDRRKDIIEETSIHMHEQ